MNDTTSVSNEGYDPAHEMQKYANQRYKYTLPIFNITGTDGLLLLLHINLKVTEIFTLAGRWFAKEKTPRTLPFLINKWCRPIWHQDVRKAKFCLLVMLLPSQCVRYVTQVWLRAKVGKFVKTPVWRAAIQYSVYTAGRPRNVLCSFS